MKTFDISTARHTLHEVATQAYGLAMGLQNAAPSQTGPSISVQYLLEVSLLIEKTGKLLEDMVLEDSSKKRVFD